MKVDVSSVDLASALDLVLPTVDRKNANPLLTNVLLTATAGKLKVTGTDNFIGGSVTVAAEVSEEGAAAVEAHRLHAVASNLPKTKRVGLRHMGPHVELKCGSSKYKLMALDADEFPTMPRVTKSAVRRVFAAQELLDCILWTSHGMTNDPNRPHLSGLLLDADAAGGMNVVACDGHQLVKANLQLGDGKEFQAFIPYRAVPPLRRLCADSEEVSMAYTATHVFFWEGTTGFNARMLGGDPIPYASIAPSEATAVDATVDCKEMIGALKRLASIEQTAIDIFVQGKSVLLSAQAAAAGEGTEKLAASTRGKPLQVAFSLKDLSAIFAVMGTEKAAIHLWGEKSPGMFRPVGDDEDHTVSAVLMPLVAD